MVGVPSVGRDSRSGAGVDDADDDADGVKSRARWIEIVGVMEEGCGMMGRSEVTGDGVHSELEGGLDIGGGVGAEESNSEASLRARAACASLRRCFRRFLVSLSIGGCSGNLRSLPFLAKL